MVSRGVRYLPPRNLHGTKRIGRRPSEPKANCDGSDTPRPLVRGGAYLPSATPRVSACEMRARVATVHDLRGRLAAAAGGDTATAAAG